VRCTVGARQWQFSLATGNSPDKLGRAPGWFSRAGAVVRDVEFVQFHPTALTPRRRGDGVDLVSEAVRGEGATLLDLDGGPILGGMHPLGDLAPRDLVAAAIHTRMLDTGTDHVLLDTTRLSARIWQQRFPTILARCLERGLDPRTEPIPVAPAQHYHCGGVQATLEGATTVPGLYAIGEVAATGLHGANRLASNSVTEAIIAAQRLADALDPTDPRELSDASAAAPLLAPGVTTLVAAATDRGCGVLRDTAGLQAQLCALDALRILTTRPDELSPAALRGAVETSNLHLVSHTVATAAMQRTESRGCHRRRDFPEAEPGWRRAQLLALTENGPAPVEDRLAVAA